MGSIGIGYKPSGSDFDGMTRNNPGNPNPENYEILDIVIAANNYIIVKLKYPDCNNYEGIKILVFDKTVTVPKLWTQRKIDPHFAKNKKLISPIARFEPTDRGMEMALKMCEVI